MTMKTRELNSDTEALVRSLFAVCADSPAKVRPCDVSRLFDMAEEGGVIPYVRQVLERFNPPAHAAFNEYESEMMEEKYANWN